MSLLNKPLARCVMVLGTTSGAGKSWLTTALCRYYARQGLKVAPFKAQNMSNNARVVASENGQGEIGSAQYFQALAANAVPDVRMNPLLLKPEADTHSQVVLMGQVNEVLSAMPWRGRSLTVWPQIASALDELRSENDVVVIEGAGSPAEINLHSSDIVNMRVALHCHAQCLLVTDIDRGGAFAHLYGTWALLPENDRALIKGFVLNKFRGDASLLAPAPQMLQERTGIPTVATLPMWWQHGLPEEDGVFDDRSVAAGRITKTVAVIAYPRISNLDEFQPLKNVPGVRLQWVRSPSELAGLKPTDWVILPGSKATAADLAWLRAQGLDAAIATHAGQGGAVLGICGGLQMLGEALIDTHGIDGNAPGLGLLPLVTVFDPQKTVRRTQVTFGSLCEHASLAAPSGLMVPNAHKSATGHRQAGSGGSMGSASGIPDTTSVNPPTGPSTRSGAGVGADLCAFGTMRPPPPAQTACGLDAPFASPWAALTGIAVSGYEIHHGRTAQHPAMAKAGDVAHAVLPDDLGWCNGCGNVLGLYLHGLFEDPAVLQALFGAHTPTLDRVFDGLADYIEKHFEAGVLASLISTSA